MLRRASGEASVRQIFKLSISAIVLALVWLPSAQAQPSDGAEVAEDAAAKLELLRISAAKGSAASQFRLAELYEEGGILERDMGKAIALYREAERQFPAAQFALAHIYLLGSGVEQDVAAAIALYRKAAEQKHESSQLALGDQYRMGLAVPRDLAESTKWYRRAADQGNRFAR